MTMLETIQLVAIIVLGVGLGIYYLVKAIKNKWLSKVVDTIKKSCAEAEKIGGNGTKKQAYVLEKLEAKCKELGIPYNLIKKLASKYINKLIEGYNAIIKN